MTLPAIDPAWINWGAQLYARRSARHDLAASLRHLLKQQGIEVNRPVLVWRTIADAPQLPLLDHPRERGEGPSAASQENDE